MNKYNNRFDSSIRACNSAVEFRIYIAYSISPQLVVDVYRLDSNMAPKCRMEELGCWVGEPVALTRAIELAMASTKGEWGWDSVLDTLRAEFPRKEDPNNFALWASIEEVGVA